MYGTPDHINYMYGRPDHIIYMYGTPYHVIYMYGIPDHVNYSQRNKYQPNIVPNEISLSGHLMTYCSE
jgi:hypothetical protein